MLSLLKYHRGREVTYARDKVYSLYGVVNDKSAFPYPLNYNVEVARLYHDLATHTITTSGTLIILAHCTYDENRLWPSWVPDWMDQASVNAIGPIADPFCAAGPSSEAVLPKAEGDTLVVYGLLLELVHSAIRQKDSMDHLGDVTRNLKLSAHKQISFLDETYRMALFSQSGGSDQEKASLETQPSGFKISRPPTWY